MKKITIGILPMIVLAVSLVYAWAANELPEQKQQPAPIVELETAHPTQIAEQHERAAKLQEIKRLMDISSVRQTMSNAVVAMWTAEYQYEKKEGLTFSAHDSKKERELVARLDGLVEALVPVYDRHFSLEEIEGMIAFMETPVGKKMVAETPQLMVESMEAGRKWAASNLR